jgi:hypothetical protein
MCGALMPGHGETMTDEAIWERLPVSYKTTLHLQFFNFPPCKVRTLAPILLIKLCFTEVIQ